MHVLVLDPDPDLRGYLAALIRYAGHRVTHSATTAEQELPLAAAADLLVLRAEGTEAGREDLRRLVRVRGRRPTVAISRASTPESVADSLCLPVQHCFTLPLLPSALRVVLKGLADTALASIE